MAVNIKHNALPALVLDTNAALDGLVFDNPGIRTLMAGLRAGTLRWLATPAMRLEFARVLRRPLLGKHVCDGEHALSQFDALAILCVETIHLLAPKLLCRDADDQRFIDLALRERVGWLVTRDRDLLCLASRARRLQLAIVTPEAAAAAVSSAPYP